MLSGVKADGRCLKAVDLIWQGAVGVSSWVLGSTQAEGHWFWLASGFHCVLQDKIACLYVLGWILSQVHWEGSSTG